MTGDENFKRKFRTIALTHKIVIQTQPQI